MESRESWLSSYRDNSFGLLSSGDKKSAVIAVSSGKGGVGKTTISLKLAERLSMDGLKVLVVDCDYNLSNTGIHLGLQVKNDFYDLVSSQKNFYQCLETVRGFDLLMACSGDIGLFTSNECISDILLDIVSTHRNEYDVVLLDCPAGLNTEVLKLCAYADFRMMVATPDPASITDTYSSIKVLKRHYNISSNHLLVNRTKSITSFRNVVKTISETAEKFLTCQTKVIGAIFEGEKPSSLSAKKFFLGKNCHSYKNVIKVLEKYSEKLVTEVPVLINHRY
jgi:flagellar biosynthesis protein FlhG